MRHHAGRRIDLTVGPDEHPSGQYRQPVELIEQRHAEGQGPALPPGVVVAERDVRRPGAEYAGIARGCADVAVESNHGYSGKGGGDGLRRAVARSVVHHDDRGLFRKRRKPVERMQNLRPAIMGQDHGSHALTSVLLKSHP